MHLFSHQSFCPASAGFTFFFVFFGRKGYFSVLLLVQLMLRFDKLFKSYVLLSLDSQINPLSLFFDFFSKP